MRGLACVEFKRDARDGQLKIIEVNHRFTLGHEIVRHAGVDYAMLAYDRLAGRATAPFTGYRSATMWHPVEDLQTMLRRRAAPLTAGGVGAQPTPPPALPAVRMGRPDAEPALVGAQSLARSQAA